MWKRWGPGLGIRHHCIQVQIALRGAALLKTGGLMTYSTCSLSPLEVRAHRSKGNPRFRAIDDQFCNAASKVTSHRIHPSSSAPMLKIRNLHVSVRAVVALPNQVPFTPALSLLPPPVLLVTQNEAAIAELLRRAGGALELVDASRALSGLRSSPGLHTWHVCDDGMTQWFPTYQVPSPLFPAVSWHPPLQGRAMSSALL